MTNCVNYKKCDWCKKNDAKMQNNIKDIKHLLKDIKEILNQKLDKTEWKEVKKLSKKLSYTSKKKREKKIN